MSFSKICAVWSTLFCWVLGALIVGFGDLISCATFFWWCQGQLGALQRFCNSFKYLQRIVGAKTVFAATFVSLGLLFCNA